MDRPAGNRAAVRAAPVLVATETVAVVGLGYVGLPVAVLAREKGWRVVGFRRDAEKVGQIKAGKVPFRDPALEVELKRFPIGATTDPSALKDATVVIVAVPTPVDERAHPDLGPLKFAIELVAAHAPRGALLSIESTINPGVCEEFIVPLLEQRGRRAAGDDLLLVHCPERVNPGDEKWTVRNIPRVLGGLTERATDRGMAFYARLLEAPVRRMSSIRAAEAVKIVENAFRDVNIAFVNELAKSFDRLGIDVLEVIEGARTKPFAFMAHHPGAGVGGHCIPVDPYYLIEHAQARGFDHQFLRLAREINKSMPRYTVDRLKAALATTGAQATRESAIMNDSGSESGSASGHILAGVRVALLGLAYKKDVADLRESPALEIEKILRAEGAVVSTYDPFIPERSSAKSLAEVLQSTEVVLVATDHSAFRNLRPSDLAGTPVRVIVDGRNCLDLEALRAAGYAAVGIGR